MLKFLMSLVLVTSCSSCYVGEYTPLAPWSPMTATNAAESTFKVNLYASGILGMTGTAWIVAENNNYTWLLTAGHLCNTGMEKYGLVESYTLVAKDYNLTYIAEKVAFSTNPDLCLLRAKSGLGPVMRLALKAPDYNEKVSYVGAPGGAWGIGLAPIFTGVYMGSHYSSAPTAPGASGSALFTEDGVVGVVVTVHPGFDHLQGFVPLNEIRSFLVSAGLY